MRPVPQQRYATGEPGKVQGRDRVVIVEGSSKYRARGSVFVENSLYQKPGIPAGGGGGRGRGRHLSKRCSDPRIANPEVRIQVRDLVRVVDIVALFAPKGVNIRGEFVLPSPIW